MRTTLLLISLAFGPFAPAINSTKQALIIAISRDPAHQIKSNAAIEDSQLYAEWLTNDGYEICMLQNEQATSAGIFSAIQAIPVSNYFVVVLLGNGVQIGGENFLAPYGTNPDSSNQLLSVPKIFETAYLHGAINTVVISDICRDPKFIFPPKKVQYTRLNFLNAPRRFHFLLQSNGQGQIAEETAFGHGLFSFLLHQYLTKPSNNLFNSGENQSKGSDFSKIATSLSKSITKCSQFGQTIRHHGVEGITVQTPFETGFRDFQSPTSPSPGPEPIWNPQSLESGKGHNTGQKLLDDEMLVVNSPAAAAYNSAAPYFLLFLHDPNSSLSQEMREYLRNDPTFLEHFHAGSKVVLKEYLQDSPTLFLNDINQFINEDLRNTLQRSVVPCPGLLLFKRTSGGFALQANLPGWIAPNKLVEILKQLK